MSLIERAAKKLELMRLTEGVRPNRGLPGDVQATQSPVAGSPDAPLGNARVLADKVDAGSQRSTVRGEVRSKRVTLDLKVMAANRLITPDAPRSQLAEEYRVLKRPLIQNAMGKGAAPIANGNLVMIGSALPNEGKSFTAVNMAMSIAAERNNTVMLVDADVARPSLLQLLGLPPSRGLLDLLTNPEADVSDMLLRTNIENLSILPGGMVKEHATELLASESMRILLENMANRYSDRIIIFDSPPLLVTTEARALAAHMGQIVLVVRAEQTSLAEVKQALAVIESCPVTLLLLNQVRSKASDGYGHGHGYGYGYGYGYGQGDHAAQAV